MSKNSRNSGKFSQGNVMGQFRRDARSDQSGSAVAQCMGKLKPQKPKTKEEPIRFSHNHLAGNV